MFNYTTQDGDFNLFKFLGHIVLGILALIVIFGSFGTIGAGERGVKTRFNAITSTIPLR